MKVRVIAEKKLVLLLVLSLLICSFTGCKNHSSEKDEKVSSDKGESTATMTPAAATPIVTQAATPEKEEEETDFLKNTQGWFIYLESGGAGTFELKDGQMTVSVTKPGQKDYSVQMYYDGFSLYEGGKYCLSFKAQADIARKIKVRPQYNGGDYHAYMEELAEVGTELKDYQYEFTMKESDPAPRLCFNLGLQEGDSEYKVHKIIIKEVKLELLNKDSVSKEDSQEETCDIMVDQVGYKTEDTKIAVLRNVSKDASFTVNTTDGETVYEGKIGNQFENKTAGEVNYYADFSELHTEGEYILQCEEKQSYPFVIRNNPYEALFSDVFHMLYLQRCGCELGEEAGKFAHPACHTQNAVIYNTDQTKDVSGGWHDAGDYGRYVVTGAVTVADLLDTFDCNRKFFEGEQGDAFHIPESNNGVPDLLDEIKYELDWLLKMQDEASGGVYHKVTAKNFPPFVMPQEEKDTLYLSPISTTATGDFAAIMAKSAHYFEAYDAAYANQCLDAAKRAWNYLEQTPNQGGFHNPADIVTGEYPDANDEDERYWAAVELYAATKEDKYQAYLEQQLQKVVGHGYGWADVSSYANADYMKLPEEMVNQEFLQKIQSAILEKATELLTLTSQDGYKISLGEDYAWGSNMQVCNNARIMLLANTIQPNPAFEEALSSHLHYLLGVNAVSYCFVTGYGTNSPQHTHHRPSSYVKETAKGMLVGGVNCNLEDSYAANVLKEAPKAKCYADNEQSFSCNEVTIYWNSPLTVLLAHFINK